MKQGTATRHEAPELMREFGARVLEEKRVYGGRAPTRKGHRLQPRARPAAERRA